MEDYIDCAHQFLEELTEEERMHLYNDLLALQDVYALNKDAKFYSLKKIKQLSHKKANCKKRSLRYLSSYNNELIIQQQHEYHIFKSHYSIKIFYNLREFDYHFVEILLGLLQNICLTQQLKQLHA
ncbi:MAG: hypothetical protein ACK5NA_06185 [Enterococcus sp.]